MDDRRDPSHSGRRSEDERWIKVQEQIMNLVTAERTDQQELTAMKTEVAKLSDHIEDIDDYLRGVAGHESLDNRIVLLERDSTANTVLLRQINKQIEDIKDSISALKLQSAMYQGTEEKKEVRFREKLKFWGPVILAMIGLILPLTRLACEHKKDIFGEVQYRPDAKLRQQIEADKRARRARETKKKKIQTEKAIVPES